MGYGYSGGKGHSHDVAKWLRGEGPMMCTFGSFMLQGSCAYSYNVRIATVDRARRVVFYSTAKYSITTTRHQRFVSAEWLSPDFAFFALEPDIMLPELTDVPAYVKKRWGTARKILDILDMYRRVHSEIPSWLQSRAEKNNQIDAVMRQYCKLDDIGRLSMRGIRELAKEEM